MESLGNEPVECVDVRADGRHLYKVNQGGGVRYYLPTNSCFGCLVRGGTDPANIVGANEISSEDAERLLLEAVTGANSARAPVAVSAAASASATPSWDDLCRQTEEFEVIG